MRVAYVCADPGVPVFGSKGASVHVQEVAAALRHAGCSVHLFAARRGGDPPLGLRDLPVTWLPCPAGDPAARERDALAANAALAEELALRGPFDIVYERYSLWSYAAMEHARATGAPGLLEVNAPLVEEQQAHRVLVDRAAAEGVAARAFGAASALLAVSRPLARWLERQPGTAGRVHVVANGVDPTRFPPGLRASRPAAPGVFTVGFVGSLKPWHGLDVLAESFGVMHDVRRGFRLLVVGDGPLRADLESALSARGVADAAELTGAVPPAEVPGLLASMDAAVAPYPPQRDFYFSPLKVYEYMVAGLPVVASRFAPLEDTIRNGVNGVLCPPGDATAFATALLDLADKPSLRVALGREARRTVLAQHTWSRVAERILGLAARVPATTGAAGTHAGITPGLAVGAWR